MENYNQHIRQKINDLNNEDLPFDESRLWQKLEEKLYKKQTTFWLAWWQFASAACIILGFCLGGYLWENRIEKSIVYNKITNLSLKRKEEPIPLSTLYEKVKTKSENEIPLIKKNKIKLNTIKLIELPSTKQDLIENKTEHGHFSETQQHLNRDEIEQINLSTPAILSPILLIINEVNNPINVVAKKQKIRVIHISEYMGEQPEIFIKPISKFTISFAKSTDIQILE